MTCRSNLPKMFLFPLATFYVNDDMLVTQDDFILLESESAKKLSVGCCNLRLNDVCLLLCCFILEFIMSLFINKFPSEKMPNHFFFYSYSLLHCLLPFHLLRLSFIFSLLQFFFSQKFSFFKTFSLLSYLNPAKQPYRLKWWLQACARIK